MKGRTKLDENFQSWVESNSGPSGIELRSK